MRDDLIGTALAAAIVIAIAVIGARREEAPIPTRNAESCTRLARAERAMCEILGPSVWFIWGCVGFGFGMAVACFVPKPYQFPIGAPLLVGVGLYGRRLLRIGRH